MNHIMISEEYSDSNFYELLRDIELSLKGSTMQNNQFAKKVLLYAPAKTGKSFTIKTFCEELNINLFETSVYDEAKLGQLFSCAQNLDGEFNVVHIRHVNIGFSDSTNIRQLIEKLNLRMDFLNKSKKVMLIISTDEFNSSLYEICRGYFEYKFGALSIIEKVHFANAYMKKLDSDLIEIREEDIIYIIQSYTSEAGIAQLKNCLEQLIVYCNLTKSIVTKEIIGKALGENRYVFDNISINREMGNGLAWTPYGGKILNLEILVRDGNGKINILGNIKKTMSDSIFISYETLYHYADKLEINREKMTKKDLYLSIPELGEVKDGASMGLAIFFKLYCVFAKKKVNKAVALSGEVMMSGDVIRVGGLKEKLNVAYAHGIKDVFLPQKSQAEILRLPNSLISQFDINLINDVLELIDVMKTKQYFG